MSAKSKKAITWIGIGILLICFCFFALPNILAVIFGNETNKNENNDATYVVLIIEDAEIKYQEDSMTLDLVKGTIKTNQQVDKIFVNVNGVGVQYIDFTANLVRTDDASYIAHALTPTECLLSTCFGSDTTLTVDMYVEYGGRSYKVDTQKIAVQSAWTDLY